MRGEDIKLVFGNICNGVDVDKVAKSFSTSEKDIMNIFQLVLFKMRSYCLARLEPPISTWTVGDARRNRVRLLELLEYLDFNKNSLYKVTETAIGDVDDLRNFG